MIYFKYVFTAFLFCGLLGNCSKAQTNPSKPIQWPAAAPVQSPAGAVEGERFESKDGGFTINISQTPVQTLDLGSETARSKEIDVGKQFIWRFENTFYTLMYSPPFDPDGNPMQQPFEDMNQGVRKGILRQNGKLISEKPITLGKYRGTEFRYVSAQGVKSIGRIYLAETIGYQIVGGYSTDEYEREVLEVLDSFKLLDYEK